MNQKQNISNLKQRLYRLRTNNASTRKYEKTINGFLMRTYRNMKSRVLGIQKKKAHLYLGKPLLNKEEFYKWSESSKEFIKLFNNWHKAKFNRKLCPSINRVDPDLGYELNNMEWITHSENSRLGAIKKHG